jgi:hypothetical protein
MMMTTPLVADDTILEALLAAAASEDSIYAYVEGTVDESVSNAALERSIAANLQAALEQYANESYPEWWML